MNELPRMKGVALIAGIIFLVIGIVVSSLAVIGIMTNLVGEVGQYQSSSVVFTLLLLLLVGLMLTGCGIVSLVYYLKNLVKNRRV